MTDNGKWIVSFGWLLGACGSTLGAVIVIVMFAITWFGNALDKKVDRELFNYICADIIMIKSEMKDVNKVLGVIKEDQAKVLQKLEIRPWKGNPFGGP